MFVCLINKMPIYYIMLKWVIKVIDVLGDFCLINNILICGYKYVQLCIENFILSLTIDVLTSLAKRHTTRFFIDLTTRGG